MSKISDVGFRSVIILLFTAITIVFTYYSYLSKQDALASEFVDEQVEASLERTFNHFWEDAKDLGAKDAVTWGAVDALRQKYNVENNHVFLVKIGYLETKDIPENFVKMKRHSLTLYLAGSEVDSTVIVSIPDSKIYYIIYSIIILIIGFLLLIIYPSHRPLDQYRLAKIYGVIFDRKVSTKKPWGSSQLTHIGSGSRLANISPNGYEQANNDKSIEICIEGIRMAMDAVEQAFSSDTDNLKSLPSHKIEWKKILTHIKSTIKDRPTVNNEEDLPDLIRYIRDVVLGTVMINVAKHDAYTEILEVEPSKVESYPSSGWITDGWRSKVYYIFMPRTTWNGLLRILNDGIRMAYETQISEVKVYTKEDIPFVFIDFVIDDQMIDAENLKRLKLYIKRSYPGDLDDLVNGVSDFGRLLILDSHTTVDLTDRKIVGRGVVKTLTVRFMMRRIEQDERNQLVEKMDNVFKTLSEEMVSHDT